MDALLQLQGISRRFGGLLAVRDLTMAVMEREILGLIGPNGAGKSTCFNVITDGPPTAGRVIFRGEDITGLPSYKIAEKGIMRTFQANILFKEMTVLENVIVGHHLATSPGLWKYLINTSSARREAVKINKSSEEIIEFLELTPYKNERIKNLPHGYQRMVGIAVAISSKPTLLLLDEPFSGMSDSETDFAMEKVRNLKEKGLTTLLIEHHMRAVMKLCDRIVVLNFGEKIAEGMPVEMLENAKVKEAYLGTEHAA